MQLQWDAEVGPPPQFLDEDEAKCIATHVLANFRVFDLLACATATGGGLYIGKVAKGRNSPTFLMDEMRYDQRRLIASSYDVWRCWAGQHAVLFDTAALGATGYDCEYNGRRVEHWLLELTKACFGRVLCNRTTASSGSYSVLDRGCIVFLMVM